MRWPRSLTRADSSPAPSRVKRASVRRISWVPRFRRKAVILSGGGVREAGVAAVEGPRRRRCSQERDRKFLQRSSAAVLAKTIFGFLVAQSFTGSFDSADSPLRRESAPLRMTGLEDVKCEIPISLPLPLARPAFEPAPRLGPAPHWGSRRRLCRQ